MALPRLTKLELQIMEALWTLGPTSIREIREAFPPKGRAAYTTIQTTVYRMEGKKAVRRVKKISTHIFEASVSRAPGIRRNVKLITRRYSNPWHTTKTKTTNSKSAGLLDSQPSFCRCRGTTFR